MLPSTALGEGGHAFTAVAKAASGVVSGASQALSVMIDTVASTTDVVDFSTSKYSRNSSSITLTGTASDNSGCVVSVDIFRDGALVKTVAASSGAWSFGEVVGNGAHAYTMQGTDTAGNVAGAAHSLILGSANGETVRGTAGADIVCGGAGYDTMSGGGGNDVFAFAPGDAAASMLSRNGKALNIETISDFSAGDKLDLRDLGHLTFGGESQTVHAYAVNWYVNNGNTFVFADVNGDGKADFHIELIGSHALTASDFALG